MTRAETIEAYGLGAIGLARGVVVELGHLAADYWRNRSQEPAVGKKVVSIAVHRPETEPAAANVIPVEFGKSADPSDHYSAAA